MTTRALLLAVASGFLLACPAKTPKAAAAPPDAGAAPPKKTITVIVTGHETGALPVAGPRLLQQWKTQDHWPDVIALSTGDTFSGAALSSHFFGEPTAEFMKALQYRAAALGNHELDLGVDTFLKVQEQSGVTFLAANVKDKADAEKPLKLPAFTVIERGGVKVGLIGLTSEKTVKTTVAGRASGIELLSFEQALPPALEGAKRAGAQVLVVLIDDCFTGLQKAFQAHPDWRADLVVGGRCDEAQEARVGSLPFFSVGDDLSSYVSGTFEVGGAGPPVVKASRKPLPAAGKEEADLKALSTRWKEKLDAELGQVIGFTKKGYKEDAPQLRTWVATALKEQAKADAALLNQKGIRAALPAGKVTKASVYSLIPFENAVLTVKVTGAALLQLKANKEAVLLLPPKLDPKKIYTLATTEYLYFGGDGLGLETLDADPRPTGGMWQTAVIEWTQSKKSNEKNPLEKLLK